MAYAGTRSRRSVAAVAALLTVMAGWGVHTAPAAHAATADKIAPAMAAAGTGITIAGLGLDATTAVTFLGTVEPADDVAAPHFVALDPKKLAVQVPAGAESGPIEITTPDGAVTTLAPLTILKAATITSLSPTWAKPDELITITGDNLMGLKKAAIAFGSKKLAPLLGSTQTDFR